MSLVRKLWLAKALPCLGLATGLGVTMALLTLANSAEPKLNITNINHHTSMQLHFITPMETPTRKYLLQYINSCPTNSAICRSNTLSFTNWSNFGTGVSFTFQPWHWYFVDSQTNKGRFYRLLI